MQTPLPIWATRPDVRGLETEGRGWDKSGIYGDRGDLFEGVGGVGDVGGAEEGAEAQAGGAT